LAHISAASNLIPAAVGIIKFRRLERGMQFLALLCVLACVQLVAENVVALIFTNNYFLVDYYTIVEFSLLAAVFYFSIDSKFSRQMIAVLFSAFFIYWSINMVQRPDPQEINTKLAMVSRVFLIAVSLVGFQYSLKEGSSVMSKMPIFWVSFAVVLYSAGTLIVFGLSNQLLKLGRPYFDIAWHINWGLLIVVNLMYSKGMICRPAT
jgi:hypothetical protein